MQTTTDRLPLYRKYGIAHFTLNGKKMSLSIYQSQELMITIEYAEHLFLPFNDATNGTLTYGGGRFIDLEIPKEGSKTIRIDFNKAYNPPCAFTPYATCPIAPPENRLAVPVRAGEKKYGSGHH
jgi:hypothetical protein